MQPFLAMIIPVGSEGGGQPGQPPGIWGPTDPRPSHPIARPPGGWGGGGGGGGPVDPGYSPPWARPGGGPVDPGYSPPWARPGAPVYPDQGLPGSQPYPDQGLPGQQPRPDQGLPPFPSHPIYFPPESGQPPLGIWGPTDPRPGYGLPGQQPRPDQGLPPFPSHPIELPPELPPTTPEGGRIEWKTAWTPQTGWIVVGIPQEPHPTPSGA